MVEALQLERSRIDDDQTLRSNALTLHSQKLNVTGWSVWVEIRLWSGLHTTPT